MDSSNEHDFSGIGGHLTAPNISGFDLDLDLPNDHPRYEDLLPDHRPAEGSSAVVAWLAQPEESEPWNTLGASKPEK